MRLREPPTLFRLTRFRLTSSILSHSTMQLLSFPQEEYERNRHPDCWQPEVQLPARSVHLSWRGVRSGKVLADDARSMAGDLRELRSGQANTVADRGLLVDEVMPHEPAEQDVLYAAIDRLVGGNDPTGPMTRAHVEIAHQIRRLSQVLGDMAPAVPTPTT